MALDVSWQIGARDARPRRVEEDALVGKDQPYVWNPRDPQTESGLLAWSQAGPPPPLRTRLDWMDAPYKQWMMEECRAELQREFDKERAETNRINQALQTELATERERFEALLAAKELELQEERRLRQDEKEAAFRELCETKESGVRMVTRVREGSYNFVMMLHMFKTWTRLAQDAAMLARFDVCSSEAQSLHHEVYKQLQSQAEHFKMALQHESRIIHKTLAHHRDPKNLQGLISTEELKRESPRRRSFDTL